MLPAWDGFIIAAAGSSKSPMTTIEAPELVNDAPSVRTIRNLKRWIAEGTLAPGEALPSERVMAERLKVNRGTLRRALDVLREDGLIISPNGRTRVVSSGTEPRRGGLMQNAVAVLTKVPGEPWVTHRQSGWSDYIGHGASHAIRAAHLHSVALHPERFEGSGMESLIAERPMGVIFSSIHVATKELLKWATQLRQAEIPCVIFSGAPDFVAFDRVMSDHVMGSYLLTKWLIQQGRTRIVQAWPNRDDSYWFISLRSGYERAMREASLPLLPPIVVSTEDKGDLYSKERFLSDSVCWASQLRSIIDGSRGADALMLASDGYLSVAAAACRSLGKVPNVDVAMVGYDNYWADTPERAYESTKPLATIDKRNLQMGSELVRLLLDRLARRLSDAPECRVVQPELVVVEGSE